MKKSISYPLLAVGIVFLAGAGAASADAFDTELGGRFKGGRDGSGYALIPQEMRDAWRQEHRVQFKDLPLSERTALRDKMRGRRMEHRADMIEARGDLETFVGLPSEQIRAARQDGKTMGDILTASGKTEADAEAFLIARANEQVDKAVERHNLTPEQEATLRGRIPEFVRTILSRWFPN